MMTRALLLTLICSTAFATVADDWTHWRGPEQNGVSRDTGLPDTWSIDGKNVVWQDQIGGRATPIVMNNRIYLNCRTVDPLVGEDKIHLREQVICRDATTGKVLWRDKFNVFQTDIPAPRVGWAAMAGDPETKQVYVHSVSGLFRCYSEDGKIMWEHSLFERFGKISGYGGRTQTPIVDEDRVIVSFFFLNWGKTGNPPPTHTYFAFDKKTGKLLWQSAPGGRPLDTNYSCPIVAVINGQRMLVGGNADGGIYGINARTGAKVFGHKMSKRGLNVTPAVDRNFVYIAHGEDNIDNTEFGRVECLAILSDGTAKSRWRRDGIKCGYTALVVNEGILYAVADTGKLYAFDSENGDELWTHSLGTVGKGSPVFADGKLYVMEVNGRIHILKPSRDGVKTLSENELAVSEDAANRGFQGKDEIYASPAVSNGKVYFVTRDRTICIGKEGGKSNAAVPLPEEAKGDDTIAAVHLIPYEVDLHAGESADYVLRAYNANGRFLKEMKPESITVSDTLGAAKANGATISTAEDAKEQSGTVSAKVGDITATARIRVFPKGDWKWDFTGYKGKFQVPVTWINATKKLFPTDLDGNVALRKSSRESGGKGRPSAYIWLGPETMSGYTVQADVMMKEQKRKLPYVGVTAHRYNFFINGNKSKLVIQSWAPHKRMSKEMRFRSDPDVWYTVKIKVDIANGKATVRGKVWKRGDAEPEMWTIEAVDPHPNMHGSPGLYFYALADSFVDNVIVKRK